MDNENSTIGVSPAVRSDAPAFEVNEDPWGGLIQEGLVEIFCRLPFEERLRVIPQVCKRWRKASYDPSCWMVVDMEPWIQRKTDLYMLWDDDCEKKVDHLVKIIVDRSCGQLQKLWTMHISNDAVDYIAERCPSLVVLSIRLSNLVTDKSALKLAATSPRLELLDVSDCINISEHALDAFGRSCPSLTWLGRNMLTRDTINSGLRASSFGKYRSSTSSPGGDVEVEVMSKSMGRLKHLELQKGKLSDTGLRRLVSGCQELEDLDLACCTALSPAALTDASENAPRLRNFRKPITPRLNVADNLGLLVDD